MNQPTHNAEREEIKQITGTKENDCNCKKCVATCKVTPCIGTPQDILAIVRAGWSKNIVLTTWAAGINKGIIPIPMLAPIFDRRKNACTFLEPNGDCALHTAGLKPTEGRLSSCKPPVLTTGDVNLSLNTAVALTWLEKSNATVLMEIISELQEQNNPKPVSPKLEVVQ